ncbi:hypothetical protein ACS0TY_011231 [Phlomoides rotata]
MEEPTQINSKSRVKCTMVTKPIDSITKEVIKDCLINQEKWSASASKRIVIQQYNAKAIQSLQVDASSYNVDDFIKNVMLSFKNLTYTTLNNVFLSLQNCKIEIMKKQQLKCSTYEKSDAD